MALQGKNGLRGKDHGAGVHAITGAHGAFHGSNAAHGLDVEFDPRGFALSAESGGRLAFTLAEVGRSGYWLQAGEPVSEIALGDRLEVDHGAFRMHYRNDERGMRHDLIVNEAPAGAGRLEARWRISGDLVPVQESEDAIVFLALGPDAANLEARVRYSGLVAWDAEGDTLPARMELHGDLVVLSVADEGATYPVTIDPIATSPQVQLAGAQASSSFGYSVATAGDVNGDGYSDILIGVPYFDGAATDAGMAMIHWGSPTGISATPAWTFQGSSADERLGFSVSSAGDLDGDGVSDLVIGAPGYGGHGAALVFLGALSTGPGASPTAIWTGDGQAASAFGHSVALAGDVDDDGRSDVLVGAPLFDVAVGSTDRGRAYCYHGSTMALSWTANGTVNNAQFGHSVAGAGDLNGDGVSDVAIGAPFQPRTPTTNNGWVHIHRGNAGSGLSLAATSSRSGPASSNFGSSVSSAGDMNGDGRADLLVGAPGTGSGAGAAHLFLGTSTGTDMVGTNATSILAGSTAERAGQCVALLGDVNGDGLADVAVGGPGFSSGAGRVRAYRGSSTVALDATHLYWSRTGAASSRTGTSVHAAGDVNGDGISDVLLGAPDHAGAGLVTVFPGAADGLVTTPQWSSVGGQASADLGRSVSSAGDVNGDGYSDVIVGASGWGGTGRAQLFLGSATGTSVSASWTGVGQNAQDLYGFAVSSAGDVNGDGYGDVLVGAPAYPNYTWRGRAYLYLGSASGLSGAPAWVFTGQDPEDRLGYSLSSAGDVNGDGYSDVLLGAY
ncbi:MAG TPA: FG-GAP-like repeat-containing protein, partial [Flavobacteriales bacterium]